MGKLMTGIQFSYLRKIGFFTFCCAVLSAIAISMYSWYFPPVMVLWCVFWFVEDKPEIHSMFKKDMSYLTLLILILLLYFWQIIGLLYSSDLKNGIEMIVMRLPFLIFPFLFCCPGEKLKKNVRLILKVFAIGVFFYILICLAYAISKSIILNNGEWIFKPFSGNKYWENYFYSSGGFTLKVHPSYFAMYCVLAFFIALESVFDKAEKLYKKAGWLIFILFIILSLYLLSSRAGFLALIITIPPYTLTKMHNKRRLGVTIAGIIVVIAILILIFSRNNRVSYYTEKIKTSSLTEVLKLDERGNLWISALNVIDRNLIVGVGTGDLKEELIKEYNKNTEVSKLNLNYNTHNQFLETLLENGLVGLIIFLSIFIWMFRISIIQKNILFSIYIIICTVFFFFESMLSRLGGISFFAFFSFLFLYIPSENKTP